MPFKGLPDAANALWEKVYNASKARGDSEEVAAKKAWSAVSGAYKKVGETWVKKAEVLSEFSMAFSAVPLDRHSGEMRWKAVASDTDKDLYQDSMSLELYKSFIHNIEAKLPPPEPFREFVVSQFWQGGMPYLSVSHYPDLDGQAVPGMPDSVYVDGKCLKAKGRFHDTELGRICWRALNKDFAENVPEGKRIRISIAFLDLAHRHGNGPVFERKSLLDRCPECAAGKKDKKYLKGYLVHLAMTRVPVNPRAEMEVERAMSEKLTREQDAASIVGEEQAKELDEKAALVGRSEVIVEKAEATAEPAKVEVPVEKPKEEPLPETSNPNPPEEDGKPLEKAFTALSQAVEQVKTMAGTKEQKAQAIKAQIDAFGAEIEKALTGDEPETGPSPLTVEMVKSVVAQEMQPVVSAIQNFQAQLATLSQPVQQKAEAPKPRSASPVDIRAIVDKQVGKAKPGSVSSIVRRSVGLTD